MIYKIFGALLLTLVLMALSGCASENTAPAATPPVAYTKGCSDMTATQDSAGNIFIFCVPGPEVRPCTTTETPVRDRNLPERKLTVTNCF